MGKTMINIDYIQHILGYTMVILCHTAISLVRILKGETQNLGSNWYQKQCLQHYNDRISKNISLLRENVKSEIKN